MIFDNAIMALTFLASAVALYFSLKKQSHDEDNIDADTIASLFKTVRELEGENKRLKKEFDAYSRTTTEQLAQMASEIVRYRNWAERLVRQLELAGIVPERFE